MSSQPSWIVRINLRGLGEKTCCCFHHTFVIGFLRALLTKFEILVLQTQNTIRDGGRTALKTACTLLIYFLHLSLCCEAKRLLCPYVIHFFWAFEQNGSDGWTKCCGLDTPLDCYDQQKENCHQNLTRILAE